MRALSASAVLLLTLVLSASAGAQTTSDMPTKLWSEYPLVQKVERAQSTAESTSIGPLLPPVDPEAAPSSGDTTRWSVWLTALALGFIALLVVARTVPPLATSGIRVVGGQVRRLPRPALSPSRTRKPRPTQLREHPPHPRPPDKAGRRAQYAPLPPVAIAEPDFEREPRHSVVRRTGFVRSRFVVVADAPGGRARRVARSRSFWRVGGEARRERAADNAWIDLVNDLRAAGWEPDYWEPDSPRSAYYVLLRKVDDRSSSLLPTIGAYTLISDDPDEA